MVYVTPAERAALTQHLDRLRGEGVTHNGYRLRQGRDGWDWLILVDGRPVAGLTRYEGLPQSWNHPQPPRWRVRALEGSAVRGWVYGRTRDEAARRFLASV